MRKKISITLLLSILFFTAKLTLTYAEDIILKSGKTVTGRVLKREKACLHLFSSSGVLLSLAYDDIADFGGDVLNFNQGVNAYLDDHYSTAIGYFKKALAINPNYGAAYNNIGVSYYSLGNHNRALVYYNKALAIDPQLSAAYANLGILYYNLGQNSNERENLAKAKYYFEAARKIFLTDGNGNAVAWIDERLKRI
ncbi:MAG: tetratricopeptide repeat protein [Candidatus Omnitrophica bacterium]|nr:tetratricopeptide repeat protein [Candidatus Omnitrophota bacterium]